MQNLSNEELATAWQAAKLDEERANKKRIEIESEIVSRFGFKEEGAETHWLDDGRKVEISGKLTYKADDMEVFVKCCEQIPADLRPIKTETKIDETGAKWLRANRPDLWDAIARAITVKPAKTAVKIKI